MDKAQTEILNSRIDGNRNILHAALLSTVGANNKDHVDSGTLIPPCIATDAEPSSDEAAAGIVRDAYEARWQHMVSRRFSSRK